MQGAQKVHSNICFRMANCFCCLSQKAMVCLAHCRQELQQKSWKTARLFLQDRARPWPRPRLSFLSSRRLETKTMVSRTTSLLRVVLCFATLRRPMRPIAAAQHCYKAEVCRYFQRNFLHSSTAFLQALVCPSCHCGCCGAGGALYRSNYIGIVFEHTCCLWTARVNQTSKQLHMQLSTVSCNLHSTAGRRYCCWEAQTDLHRRVISTHFTADAPTRHSGPLCPDRWLRGWHYIRMTLCPGGIVTYLC